MNQARPFETSDGTVLNVDTAGEGTSVLFQHGLCGDAGQTGEAFPAGSGFCRITVEARGHGRSQAGRPDKLSIATFADDIVSYIENVLAAPVVVGGISMGAAIALRLAVKRPDLVSALILARPAWVTCSAPANMAPNAEVGHLLKSMSPDAAKRAFLQSATAQQLAAEAPDNLASLAGFFSRLPPDETAQLLIAISSDGPDVTDEEVSRISVPTLVIGHERDAIHPIAHARTLAKRIPMARFIEITPKAENRAQYVADFRRAMSQFLKEL